MKSKDGWVKIYLVVMAVITIVISFITIYDIVAYSSGEKGEAIVTEAVNKRVKAGARGQTSNKKTKVKIRYSVDGTEYNEEIDFQGWYKFTEGESIKISYNPDNPKKVYIPQMIYRDIKGDVLWGIFVGLQVGLFVSYERKRKQKNSLIPERTEI